MTYYTRKRKQFHNDNVQLRKEGEMMYVKQLADDLGLDTMVSRLQSGILSSIYIRHPFWNEQMRVSDHLLPVDKLDRENYEWHKRFGIADLFINVYAERSASFYQRFLDRLCSGPDLRHYFKVKGRDFSNPNFRQFVVRFKPERYNFGLKVFRNGNCAVIDAGNETKYPNFRAMLGSFSL